MSADTQTIERTTPLARPATLCPTHKHPLDGGPVRYRCPAGHGVQAADIDHEYHPPGGTR